ncbi:hypothetical protein GCM10008941_15660 [Rhizomicrobium palustre]
MKDAIVLKPESALNHRPPLPTFKGLFDIAAPATARALLPPISSKTFFQDPQRVTGKIGDLNSRFYGLSLPRLSPTITIMLPTQA